MSYSLIEKQLTEGKTIILDGGIGGELQKIGAKMDKGLWCGRCSIDSPDELLKVHENYINAGADIITANTYATHSDRELKTGIKPMTSALDKVMMLEPVTYEMKGAPGKSDLGFIAQDVAKIVPEICVVDGKGVGRAIDYGRMSAVLAGAVKAQQTQIDELKAVIAKLQK